MNLNTLTITKALSLLQSKKTSAVELTQACLDHIERSNDSLNTFLTLNP
jgi:Asp-tRNA(Asn)/Glu-tRNA(Gln) amidotransferase A subunit family amidase